MTIDTDLATLREHLPADYLGPDPNDMDGEKWGQHPEALAALDRVEAELARLQEANDAHEQHLEMAAQTQSIFRARAETAERELARLREGLRDLVSPRRLYSRDQLREAIRALLAEDCR